MQAVKRVAHAPVTTLTQKGALKKLSLYQIVSPRIGHITTPPVSFEAVHIASTQHNHQQFLEISFTLAEKYGKSAQEALQPLAQQLMLSAAFTDEGREAFHATLEIYKELLSGNYSQEAGITYLRFATNLFLNHLQGGAVRAMQKAEEVRNALLSAKDFEVLEGDDAGSGNSYAILDGNNRMLRIKESRKIAPEKEQKVKGLDGVEVTMPLNISLHDPYCHSSYQRFFPNMPLTTTQADHELIGYELDAIIGLDRTPLTFKASLGVDAQEETFGSVQVYVPNSKSADSYLYEDHGAMKYATLDVSRVHLTALSGMYKGLSMHHWSNYLMKEEGDKITDVLEIDTEECMLPFNRVPNSFVPSIADKLMQEKKALEEGPQSSETLAKLTEIDRRIRTMQKTYICCRLFIIGLWQSKKPFERALLMAFAHPSLKKLVDGYHDTVLAKQTTMHPDSIAAQKERVAMLQRLSVEALSKPKIEASPRDFYFEIFGGRDLYEMIRAKRYPDLFTFNQLVGDPYPDRKDFANPESLPECKIFDVVNPNDPPVKRNLREVQAFY